MFYGDCRRPLSLLLTAAVTEMGNTKFSMMTMMITVEMRTLSSNSDFDYLEYVGSDDTDKNCDDKEDSTDLKIKILLLSKRAKMRLLQCIKRKLRIKEAHEEGGCAKQSVW